LPRGNAADNSVSNAVATVEGTIMLTAPMFSRTALLAAAVCAFAAAGAQAQQATEIQLSYKDKKFDPAEVTVPANTAFTIRVKNLDAKAMEFESKPLKIEKVIAANSEAVVNVRAQKPGKYKFVDEYNEDVAIGNVIVK
jgi:plastocyanin